MKEVPLKSLLKILACPLCKKDLKLKKDKLVCSHCGKEYPVKKGIPRLLPE
jgi:uncharacterized protein YbaR (Trm112 family)